MLVIRQQLDNDDHYIGTNHPEWIVMHGTGNKTDSDEANANFFCSGKRNSGAHYFGDDDSITQTTLDRNGAYHCGDGYNKYGINNNNSIGIEMCQRDYKISELTKQNIAELIRQKMAQYNIPIERVVRHYDASRKLCPEAMSANDWAEWKSFKQLIIDGSKNGWYLVNGKWYYYVNSLMAVNSWAKDSYGDWFYLGIDGTMVTNGWAKDSTQNWFYLGSDGRIVKNQWVNWINPIDKINRQYFLNDKGEMLYDTITPDKWRVLSTGEWDGKAQCL